MHSPLYALQALRKVERQRQEPRIRFVRKPAPHVRNSRARALNTQRGVELDPQFATGGVGLFRRRRVMDNAAPEPLPRANQGLNCSAKPTKLAHRGVEPNR